MCITIIKYKRVKIKKNKTNKTKQKKIVQWMAQHEKNYTKIHKTKRRERGKKTITANDHQGKRQLTQHHSLQR